MGYTTMGHNFASAFYVQLVAILIAPTVAGTTNIGENFSTGIVPIGIAAIVLGILGMIFIRNEPWERGINPTTSPTRSTRRSMTPRTPSRGTAGGPPANCWPPRSSGWRPLPPAFSRSAPWAS